MIKVNQDVRESITQSGLHQWQVAEILGLSEWTFIRKLRYELDHDKKAKVLQAIKKAEVKYK